MSWLKWHCHKFVPFKSLIYEIGRATSSGNIVQGYITEVYEACACGERRMRKIDGQWTLDMLTKPTPETA